MKAKELIAVLAANPDREVVVWSLPSSRAAKIVGIDAKTFANRLTIDIEAPMDDDLMDFAEAIDGRF